MPKRYVGIKKGLIEQAMKKGTSTDPKKIKRSAARIYNASRKPGEKPVTRKHDSSGY